jgi:hypothetical protein
MGSITNVLGQVEERMSGIEGEFEELLLSDSNKGKNKQS